MSEALKAKDVIVLQNSAAICDQAGATNMGAALREIADRAPALPDARKRIEAVCADVEKSAYANEGAELPASEGQMRMRRWLAELRAIAEGLR